MHIKVLNALPRNLSSTHALFDCDPMAPATTSTLPRRASAPRIATAAPHSSLHSQARAKRSGGPEDRALYRCGCGYAFKAQVSTTVGCPSCGQTQAW